MSPCLLAALCLHPGAAPHPVQLDILFGTQHTEIAHAVRQEARAELKRLSATYFAADGSLHDLLESAWMKEPGLAAR